MHVVDKSFHADEIPLIPIDFQLPFSARSVSAESSFGFRLCSSGLSNRNVEDSATVDFLSEELLF